MNMYIWKARNRFTGISIFCAVFAAIYEFFSHGVYSKLMIFAFLIPLAGVVIPYTFLMAWCYRRNSDLWRIRRTGILPDTFTLRLYQSSILTFTLGSIFLGMLEIYGTTNRLSKFYWIAGGLLLVFACLREAVRYARARINRLCRQE